jgi:HEAT repeat protein
MLDQFLAAVARHDDAEAECCAHALTPADEAPLLALLAGPHPDPDTRWWAVRGLAGVGSADAAAPLAGTLADPDPGVRAASALALGHLHARHPAAVTLHLPAVAALLADDEGYVRQAAADCLALCGDDGVPPLGAVLRHSDHEGARTRAAAALRKIATLPAAAILYALLNDRNHLVRAYAYEGLDELGLLENVLVMPA